MARSGRTPRSFLSDLKSRGVLQTLGVYLVAAWAIIEVSSTILPYLGLSDRAVTAIIVMAGVGIPIVTVLAWVFEVTPEGVRRTDPEEVSALPARRVGWRWVPLALGAVVVAVSLGGLVWTRFFAPPPPDLGAVAVFPFNVQGDAEIVGHLGEGMVTLLTRELDGVAGLRGTDPNTMLSLAEHDPRGLLDPGVARELARSVGAAHFVLGTVTEVTGRIALSARLYGESAGVEPATASAEGALNSTFELAQALIAQLLAQQVGPASRTLSHTAARDTESLPAFKAFVDAERHLRANRREEAIVGFQRAVAEDGGFALAYYRLAVAAGLSRNYRLVESSLERAAAYADRLGERDRRLLDAFVALRAGRIDEAEARYWAIIEDHPDTWEARFQLGEMLTEHNPARGRSAREGLPLLEAVTEVDPAFVCPSCTMANHALSRRNLDLADSLQYARTPQERLVAYAAASAAARDDSVGFDRWFRPGLAFYWQAPWIAAWFEDYLWAERLARSMLEGPAEPAVQVHATFILTDLMVARGRWEEAWGLLVRASQLAPGRTLLRRAFYLTQPMVEPDETSVREAIQDLEAWSGTAEEYPDLDTPLAPLLPQARRSLLALLEIRRGAHGEALAWADSLETTPDPADARGMARDLALTVRADVALREGRPADALRLLEGIQGQIPIKVMDLVSTGGARVEFADLFTQEHARLLRVRALLQRGRPDEARRWVDNGFFRIGGNALLTPTLRRLEGDVHAASGDGALARERYARFLELWADADPPLRAAADSVLARADALGARVP